MRLPEPTIRNALVTSLLPLRVSLLCLGLILQLLSRAVDALGEAVPGWTDAAQVGRSAKRRDRGTGLGPKGEHAVHEVDAPTPSNISNPTETGE